MEIPLHRSQSGYRDGRSIVSVETESPAVLSESSVNHPASTRTSETPPGSERG
jgi:hypothetical protein